MTTQRISREVSITSLQKNISRLEVELLELKSSLVLELKRKYRMIVPSDCMFEETISSNVKALFTNLFDIELFSIKDSFALLSHLEKNNITLVWHLLAPEEFPLSFVSIEQEAQYKELKQLIINKYRITFEK